MIVFLFSNSKIMSHSPFACNWKKKKGFWDSELIFTHFPSNKSGTSDIRIPCNSTELHPTPCIHVVCHMCGLGPSCMSKQNVLSLILLIPLVKLMNQKKGICRHRILYPLQLGPPFPNDVGILKAKVGLGLD